MKQKDREASPDTKRERSEGRMMRKLGGMRRDETGITGLETAIILIAFVVVAAVFAYTALSAGLFSTQKSKEAVYAGLQEAQSTLELRGDVIAYANSTTNVGKVEFTLGLVAGGEPIDLQARYSVDSPITTLTDNGSSAAGPTLISFSDDNTRVTDCAWTVNWVAEHDSDNLLEDNEKAAITVWLHNYTGGAWVAGTNPPFLASDTVTTNHTFIMEVKPAKGAVLCIERTTPAALNAVMSLR